MKAIIFIYLFLISNCIYSQVVQFRNYFKNGSFEVSKMGFKENATLQIDSLFGEIDISNNIDNFSGIYQNQSADSNYNCLNNWYNGNEIYFSSTFKSIKNFRSFKSSDEIFFESILHNSDSINFISISMENSSQSLNEVLDYLHFNYNNCRISSIILFENLSATFHELIIPLFDQQGNKLTSINTKFKDDFISNVNNFEISKLKIYPNPTNGQLTVDSLQDGETLKIYSIFGEFVNKTSIYSNKLDVSYLQDGVYILVSEKGHKIKVVKLE
jgi:hypothetical protein